MEPAKENARRDDRAKKQNKTNVNPATQREQPRRLPTPTELKRAIDPASFYASEIPNAPPLKARKDGWTQNVKCPFHDPDTDGSFGANVKTGAFRCFACDAQGGSILDFVMLRDGLDLDGARADLAERYRIEPSATAAPMPPGRPAPTATAAPRPAPAPAAAIPTEALASRPQAHPKHGAPSATWEYRDAAGRPLAFILRFDPAEGRKSFAPLTWAPAGGWTWKAPPEPRPLYGLDRLAASPDAPALLCEGEKSADAGGALFPAAVPIASMNGSQAPAKSAWTPLSGRRVLIWPDADAPGAKYADEAARLALAAGARSVGILDLASLATDPATGEPRELPKGWDAADALADGWTVPTIAAAAHWQPFAIARPTEPERPETTPGEIPTPAGMPYGFEAHESGIRYRKPSNGDGKGNEPPPLWICPPLRVVAVTRDNRGDEFGRLVEFTDLDGRTRGEVISDRERAGSGDALRARLAALGFEIATTAEGRRLFLELLRQWRPETRARSVTKTGWTDDGRAFVLPDMVIGEGAEPVILASDGERPGFGIRGSVESWRDDVAILCLGNSLLVFVVSAAFAPPLLHLTGGESGGFQLLGASTNASSSGKTTAQRVASSVCGPPEYLDSARTTDNASETAAELRNDCLLNVDEFGQADPKTIGETIYMWANGRAKRRMDRTGRARPVPTWRLLFLTSGEIGLAAHMATANKRTRAGQETRLAEIPADAGAGLGLFEDLHGYPSGAAFALALTERAANHYGAPFVRFIESILEHRAELPAIIKTRQSEFVVRVLKGIKDPAGQVQRVAARFGLVAVAGELATADGITGWPPGTALAAAERCFGAWLKARGGDKPSEELALLGQVRHFFEQHGNRFRWKTRVLDDHAPEVQKQAGFKDTPPGKPNEIVYYAFPETFRAEIVAGFDATDAARVLIRNGVLLPDSEGKPTRKNRFPGFPGQVRTYVFPASMGLSEPDDEHPEGTRDGS